MSDVTARVADATGNWVDTHAPSWSRPYLRLSRFDRPIGSWLLLMPCWWSAALAAGIARDVSQLLLVIVLFFIGAFVMRGAGCTWNDITDRDLDAQVERTRSRPIPAGQVSVTQAAVFLVAAGADRLGGAAAVQPLRDHDRHRLAGHRRGLSVHEADHLVAAGRARPRLLLGRADGICGHRSGGSMRPRCVLYAGSIAWVIGYDTIYAHQDAEDDALIGIKSTARLFGARTHRALAIFYASGGGADRRSTGAGRRALAGLDRACRIRRASGLADPPAGDRDPALCLRLFKSNRDAGLLLFAGLLVDAVMRAV